MKIKKLTRGGHADPDNDLDIENAEIDYDIISEDQLEDEENYSRCN
jgi:hypothetical protein